MNEYQNSGHSEILKNFYWAKIYKDSNMSLIKASEQIFVFFFSNRNSALGGQTDMRASTSV